MWNNDALIGFKISLCECGASGKAQVRESTPALRCDARQTAHKPIYNAPRAYKYRGGGTAPHSTPSSRSEHTY